MNILNIVDAVILISIIMFGFIGAKRGVFQQIVTTVGFIIVVVLAFYLKNPIAEFLSLYLPFFKFGGIFAGVTSLNIILYQLLAFIIVASILQAILNVLIKITGVIEKILKFTIILGIPSKILGFIAGVVEGFVIVFLALFFLRQPAFNFTFFEGSVLTDKVLNSTPILSQISGSLVDTFNDLYELRNDYIDEKINDSELNLKSIDVMLEHKIITPDYVIKLVDNNKIKEKDIYSVINKYK